MIGTIQPVHVRWMIRRDMPEVVEIESLLERRPGERPWSEEDFGSQLRQRNCIGMVAERGDRVLGHMVYVLHEKSLEILRLTVHPDCRGQRIGTAMIKRLKSKLSPHRRRALECVVPLDPGLCGWLKGRGFRGTWDPDEDKVFMAFVLPCHTLEEVNA